MVDLRFGVAALATLLVAGCIQPPPRPPVLPATKDAVADTGDVSSDASPVDSEVIGDSDAAEPDTPEKADAEIAADDSGPEVDATAPECAIAADCPPPAQCRGAATCDQPAGKCSYPDLVGSPCEDGNICTELGSCAGGKCVAPAKDCDDKIPCTEDSCDPQKGCRHDLSACPCTKDAECDDGDLCTLVASCKSLACVGGEPVDCSGLDAICTVGQCDSTDGSCVSAPRVDETPCDDGDPCTEGDGCGGGVCQPGAPACDDANPCTTDSCAVSTGECSNIPAADGIPCNDGDFCTIGDTCNAGICAAVKRLDPVVAWEATLRPVLPETIIAEHGLSAAGDITVIIRSGEPVTLMHSGGTTVLGAEVSETQRLNIVRLDPSGKLFAHRVFPADGPILVASVAYTPEGGGFALVDHDASLTFDGSGFHGLAPEESNPARTLLYFSAAAEVVWSMRFEPELTPYAVFYSAGPPALVGVVATHQAAVTGPVVVGPTTTVLPAATVPNRSLSVLTWTLAGAALVSRDIGWMGAKENGPLLVAKADAAGRLAMVLSSREEAVSLNGIGEVPWASGSSMRAVLALFGADGELAGVATGESPTQAAGMALEYGPSQGLVAFVWYDARLTAKDSSGKESIVVAEEGPPGLLRSCFVRLDSVGGMVWPLNCESPGLRSMSSIRLDGSLSVVARGFVAEAPAGGDYWLTASTGAPTHYIAEVSATGEFQSLGVFSSPDHCSTLSRGADGKWIVGCLIEADTPYNYDGITVRSIDALPPPPCAP